MPLIKSKSKKAFSENVAKEMDAGKPQKQSLAIAYSIKRHPGKKKMAKGGPVESGKGPEHTGEPGIPQAKPDDRRIPPKEYMNTSALAGDPAPAHKPDNHRLPMDEYMANHFAMGGSVQGLDPEQAKHLARHLMSMHSMEPSGTMNTNNPGTPGRKPDDSRPSQSAIMGKNFTDGEGAPSRKPDDRRLPEDQYMGVYAAEGGRVSPTESIMRKRKMMAEGGYVDLNPPRDEGTEYYDNQNSKAAMKELYTDDDLDSDPWDSNESGDDREDKEENKLDMIGSIRKKMKTKANRD